MVMRLTGVFLVSGSNPGRVNTALPPPLQSANQDSNRRPKMLCRLCYHSTGGCVIAISFPTAWSLLSENF